MQERAQSLESGMTQLENQLGQQEKESSYTVQLWQEIAQQLEKQLEQHEAEATEVISQ